MRITGLLQSSPLIYSHCSTPPIITAFNSEIALSPMIFEALLINNNRPPTNCYICYNILYCTICPDSDTNLLNNRAPILAQCCTLLQPKTEEYTNDKIIYRHNR